MQYDSEGEYIQLWLDWYYMDRSIYNALFYLEKYPTNVFPRATLALSLAFISMKQKNLQAGNYLAMPSPDYDESFNRLLQMLREINPKENGLLSYWMIRPIDEDLKKTEVYLAALVLSAYSAAKPDEYASLRAEYNTKFPEGRYLQFFPVEEEKKK
jgi:CRISPR/Cas system CMR-associated protein Cmr5 small subunit